MMDSVAWQPLLTPLLLWFLGSILVFSLMVLLALRSGAAFRVRQEDGSLRQHRSGAARLLKLLVLALLVGLLLLFDYSTLVRAGVVPDFWLTLTLNFSLFFLIFLYDTVIIDYWVIGRWRPGFLRLPAALDSAAMRHHIRATLVRGPLLLLLLAVISAGLVHLIW